MSDSFAAAGEAALASLTSPAETPTPVAETPAAPAAATPEAPAVVAPGVTPVDTPQVVAQPVHKVKVAGKELEVPLDELLNGYSRQKDYTQKAMELADQRKQFEAQVTAAQEQETAIRAFLQNADEIAKYYQHLTGQQLPTPSPADPNQIATVGQTEQMLQAAQQRLQSQVQQVQDYTHQQLSAIHQAEMAKQASAINADITQTIQGVLADERFKSLAAIEGIADVLCGDAMRLEPANMAEAKAAILQVAQQRATKLNSHFQEMLKASAVTQAKLSNGIEPPGGQGVTPQPTQHKLGSKDLQAAATAWLQSQTK